VTATDVPDFMGDDHVPRGVVSLACVEQVGVENQEVRAQKPGRKGIQGPARLHQVRIGRSLQPGPECDLLYAAMQIGRTAFWLLATPKHRTLVRHNAIRILLWLCASAVFWILGGLAEGVFDLDLFWHVTGITSEGFAHLVHLPNLGSLGCDGKLSDNQAMRHIALMPRLCKLRAQESVANDDGFAALSKSRTLEFFWGRECSNFGSRGFVAFSKMPALRSPLTRARSASSMPTRRARSMDSLSASMMLKRG
jgi:hypothetical protein